MKRTVIIIPHKDSKRKKKYSEISRYLRYTDRISMVIENDDVYLLFDDDDKYALRFVAELPYIIEDIKAIEEVEKQFNEDVKPLVEMPISTRKDISVFSKELLHMQLPFFTEEYYPWFYSHFINIYYCPDGFMNYPDERRFSDIIEIKNIGFEAFSNMNSKESFVHSMQKGLYIHIWVDNFWISNSPNYQSYHDVHPVLIHGYNLDKNTYKCARFDLTKSLDFVEIPIDELHNAVESAKIYFYSPTEEPFKMIKLKRFERRYQNSYGRFLSEIKDYRNGAGSREYSYFVHNTVMSPSKEFFGLSVTQCFIDGLKQPGLYNLFDYRMLHLIVENKRLILNAMKYHNGSGTAIPELSDCIVRYERLAQDYERIRLLYIKQSLIESSQHSFYDPPKNEAVLERMIDIMNRLLIDEKDVLDKYIPLAEEKYILDRGNELKMPLLYSTNEFNIGRDENGQYYEIWFDKPIAIGDVEIYDSNRLFEGKIYLGGDAYDCLMKDAVYNFLHIRKSESTVRTIRYYPSTTVLCNGKPDIYINVFKPNVLLDSTISASSVYSEFSYMSFDPNNVLTPADTFDGWACECNDKERFLRFDLREPRELSAFSMSQLKLEQRILAYSVEFYDKNGECIKTISYDGDMGSEPTYHTFGEITAAYIIVRILKTKVDTNGYDIPRVTNVSLY